MESLMNIAWQAARFGLTLIGISAKVIAILFFLHAAISLALAPWVVGAEIMGLVGFGLALAIAAIYLGVVRYAFITQSEDMVIQIAFVIFSIVVCQLVYAHPATLEKLLTAFSRITPGVLLAGCGVFLIGGTLNAVAFGGAGRWVFSVLAVAAMLGAILLTLEVTQSAGDIPIPALLRNSPLYSYPRISAVGLGCLSVMFLELSLRQTAVRFHDSPTREYVQRALGYHVIAAAIVLGIDYFLQFHTVKPMIVIGDHGFDTAAISASAVICLLAAIDGLWLSRAVAGARDLINPQRA